MKMCLHVQVRTYLMASVNETFSWHVYQSATAYSSGSVFDCIESFDVTK